MIHHLANPAEYKKKALQWATGFDVCCYLDSNDFNDRYSKFDALLAVGVKAEITAEPGTAFERLQRFRQQHPGWMTGFLTYDLKNEIESLSSENPDSLDFPGLYFFVPQHLLIFKGDKVEIMADNAAEVFKIIEEQEIRDETARPKVKIQSRMTKIAYVNAVRQIQDHINRGDIYVTNFCQEFFADDAVINPPSVFVKLNEVSPNPFAAFFKIRDKYVLCATPERFLAKRGSKLISQPIKGTTKRGETAAEDDALIHELRNHAKELQENVMIVDLVRNDLTHSAKPGTVKTEELYGIYSFAHVHQMISTVVCELADSISDVEAIKNTFPMGSMTGAPKISAMQLMEKYERSRRGVYSGAIGYFSPGGDFDFNVVIRTILYNQTKKHLSFQAGSAITYHADPEKEYDECLLKAQAILEVLGNGENGYLS